MAFLISHHFSEEEEADIDGCITTTPAKEEPHCDHVNVDTGGYDDSAQRADRPRDHHGGLPAKVIGEEGDDDISDECSKVGAAADQVDYGRFAAEVVVLGGQGREVVAFYANEILPLVLGELADIVGTITI